MAAPSGRRAFRSNGVGRFGSFNPYRAAVDFAVRSPRAAMFLAGGALAVIAVMGMLVLSSAQAFLAINQGSVNRNNAARNQVAELLDGAGLPTGLATADGAGLGPVVPLAAGSTPTDPVSADDVVNSYDQQDLAGLIKRNSDERFASRIAAAIVAARPVTSTNELAEIVVNAIPAPARRRGGHPAKRTFQAIRIEVNDELTILGPALARVLDALVPGGRGIVITYHSGEDRITKDEFRRRTIDDRPRDVPVDPVGVPGPDYEIVRPMARQPQDAEVVDNPRAASARLRAIERIAA